MFVKTHLHGRDSKEMVKELLLDEHESCGCQCRDLSPLHCAGTFNPQRCECVCPSEQFGAEQATVNSFNSILKLHLLSLLSKHPRLFIKYSAKLFLHHFGGDDLYKAGAKSPDVGPIF